MKKKRITSKPSGAFLLPVLMLFFILFNPQPTNSRSGAFEDHLRILALTVDQIIFRDSNPSESLSNTLVKFSVPDGEFTSLTVDVASRILALSEAFLITHSTFNTFYHHVTINAP